MGGVAAQRRCDVDSDDAARRCLIRAVTGERGIVGAYSGVVHLVAKVSVEYAVMSL